MTIEAPQAEPAVARKYMIREHISFDELDKIGHGWFQTQTEGVVLGVTIPKGSFMRIVYPYRSEREGKGFIPTPWIEILEVRGICEQWTKYL
jgi:hypothetical protein